jgi:hypothetical protein
MYPLELINFFYFIRKRKKIVGANPLLFILAGSGILPPNQTTRAMIVAGKYPNR